ncbi:MAG: hypothetical protein KJ970_02385 [Candidatus Eisenbacteria bacterium]|uniref:Uncharacterized protein n=1 Tax=Eiseniibacteriota bacterium TaxID=2212470 RepID=A0A948RTK5_UNCEI|nr:hypothetical protein [Candidatus Eisenbacteria bacterium]MBU1948635.1 hypothetical protein [Candidatus Eisenbacteria bacterium]MBU2689746.1 hypothetical protein [Candidatus Eisenbacteria bacterium]
MADKKASEPSDRSRYLSWILGVYFIVLFHIDKGWPGHIEEFISDGVFLGLAVLFFLVPFITRISIGKLFELERQMKTTKNELEATRSEVLKVLSVVSTSISANVGNTYMFGTPVSGTIATQLSLMETPQKDLTRMEYKILRTLWTHQVNRYADLGVMFTFRIHMNAMEFMEVREAATKLIRRGYIGETPEGQYVLSLQGLEYCLAHYREFPPDKWFEPAAIEEENIPCISKAIDDAKKQISNNSANSKTNE